MHLSSLDASVLSEAVARLNDVILIAEAEPVDLPGPRIVYVNDAFERMTGYSAAEVIGQTPRILHGPRTSRAELDRLRVALERWEPCRVSITNYRKNGVPFDVEFELVPVADAVGWFTHWVSVQRDVTTRTLAEAAIRSATTVRSLISAVAGELGLFTGAAGAAVAVRSGPDAPWSHCHVALEARADAPRDPAITTLGSLPETLATSVDALLATIPGLPSGVIVPLETPSWTLRALHEALPVSGEITLVLWRPSAAAPWPLAETLLQAVLPRLAVAYGRLAVQRDRARLQRELIQAQKLQALGRLAAGVAHDFNNILTIITGNLEFLRAHLRDQLPREPAELGELLAATDRAHGLVDQLLASRTRPAVRETVDLGVLVASTATLVQRTLGADIAVRTDIGPGGLIIHGDSVLLEHALLNLALNARDAILSMPSIGEPVHGQILIAVKALDQSVDDALLWAPVPAGPCIELTVTDSGPGMSDAVQQSAFEPFFTTKAVGAGTGLGLSSVLGAVTALHGAIRLEHAAPCGVVVRMRFPAGMPQPTAPSVVPALRSAVPRRTVLVVEDEDAVRALVVRALANAGYEVLQATNGRTALEQANASGTEIAAVITDERMPVMSGSDMVRELRRRLPDVPVLFMSGNADDPPLTEFGGVTRIIKKPFLPSRLLAVVEQLLPQAAATDDH